MQDLIWKLLLSMAFIYMAGRVPSLLGNGGAFDAWLRTLYFGMSLPSSIMRSSRAIGLIAGGAAGGPAGMAAGALVAGGGITALSGSIRSAAGGATSGQGGSFRSADE